jgi:hypothetical protein
VSVAPRLIPALLRFTGSGARQDSWGRLLKLTAGGAVVSTLSPLAKGEVVGVTFEVGADRITASGVVDSARRDDDGGWVGELRWRDMVERRRIARALVELLARA